MRIDERRFDFLPPSKWKNLSKKDSSNLQSFKSYYGHYKRTQQEIDDHKSLIKRKREKVDGYLSKMKKINYDIDHLRNDYNFSWSVTKLKNKNYFNGCISRRGHMPKSISFGSPKLIEKQLREHYRINENKLKELDRLGWKNFIRKEMNDRSGKSKVRNRILDMITKDTSLKKFSITREMLFPIK